MSNNLTNTSVVMFQREDGSWVAPSGAVYIPESHALLRATTAAEQMRQQVRAEHAADIELIGNRMIHEAEDRGWCEEFDDITNELNEHLHVDLPWRKRNYEVSITYRVTVTRTVSARSASEAEEDARCEVSSDQFRIANSDYEVADADFESVDSDEL